eukprot:symbB.v1.2.035481.t1/scaffold4786.1/size34885/1
MRLSTFVAQIAYKLLNLEVGGSLHMAPLPGAGTFISLVHIAGVFASEEDFEWHGDCTGKFRFPKKFPVGGDPQNGAEEAEWGGG